MFEKESDEGSTTSYGPNLIPVETKVSEEGIMLKGVKIDFFKRRRKIYKNNNWRNFGERVTTKKIARRLKR